MAAGATPQRVIRIDDSTWAAYGDVCAAKGISRSDDIRMHVKAVIADFGRQQRREGPRVATVPVEVAEWYEANADAVRLQIDLQRQTD